MMKVSVLLPIYKTSEKDLKDCIDSILNQSFTNFELIILDDCPEDTRESFIKTYNDPRIMYKINYDEHGIANVRNKLISMASGELLAICDHDDISDPFRFEKQVSIFEQHENIGVVSSFIEPFPKKFNTFRGRLSSYEIKKCLTESCIVYHQASMIKRSILIENNIKYDQKYTPAEDYKLWCDLIEFTDFYIIPEILLKYRVHGNNTSILFSNKIEDSRQQIVSYAQMKYFNLYIDHLLTKSKITYIKIFGINLLKIVKSQNKINILLFCYIPICKIKQKDYFD